MSDVPRYADLMDLYATNRHYKGLVDAHNRGEHSASAFAFALLTGWQTLDKRRRQIGRCSHYMPEPPPAPPPPVFPALLERQARVAAKCQRGEGLLDPGDLDFKERTHVCPGCLGCLITAALINRTSERV